jgi:hypothetical protein
MIQSLTYFLLGIKVLYPHFGIDGTGLGTGLVRKLYAFF